MSDNTSFEKLKSKLIYINGLIELKKKGEQYSTEQQSALNLLGSRLTAIIESFNTSGRNLGDVKSTLACLKVIEKETKAIIYLI